MTRPPIVELKGITKRFPGVLALDDVGMTIEAGTLHAVVGENGAGKSTLMNVLAGELQPDAGEILLDGEEITIPSPMASQRLGIKVVYQELSLCANLSVAENIMIDQLAARPVYGLVRRGELRRAARESLERLGMTSLDPATPVASLTVAQKQLVEIARAISQRARILVLDEPNSALAKGETAMLFRVIEQLKAEGVTILYVSHHLEEVLDIADRISVMRDGRHIETVENNGSVTPSHLISSMVGRALELSTSGHARPVAANSDHPVVLDVAGLSAASSLDDVTFQLRAGEILGIAGLPDSGKDDLPAAVFGLIPRSGTVTVHGAGVPANAPRQAIRAGMALIPADRRGAGALLSMSVQENVVASSLGKVSRLGFVDSRKVRAVGRSYVRQLDARIAHLRQKIRTLSGGNQQKIIIARGLATRPRVLILHEPTRGIDVGAKAEIYGILAGLAEQGVGILLISSEMPELISQCGRVLILHQGRITGEVSGAGVTEEAILSAAMGQ